MKFELGSAEGWTSVRASAGRGNRGGSDNLLRRAWSFVDDSAARGCGDGSFSSGNGRRRDLEAGVDVGSSGTSTSNSVSFDAEAPKNDRACILALCDVVFLDMHFAAAYGHEGRRGSDCASNCEAHLETGTRFIKSHREKRRKDLGRKRVPCSNWPMSCVLVVECRGCPNFSAKPALHKHLAPATSMREPHVSDWR